MAGGLNRRVRRLEQSRGGEPCPECGFDGDWTKVETEVTLEHVPGPDGCPECGRVLVIRIPGGSPPGVER